MCCPCVAARGTKLPWMRQHLSAPTGIPKDVPLAARSPPMMTTRKQRLISLHGAVLVPSARSLATTGGCVLPVLVVCSNTLKRFGSWRGALVSTRRYATWHLFTNCYPPPGTVGLAYMGVTCNTGTFGVGWSSFLTDGTCATRTARQAVEGTPDCCACTP